MKLGINVITKGADAHLTHQTDFIQVGVRLSENIWQQCVTSTGMQTVFQVLFTVFIFVGKQ